MTTPTNNSNIHTIIMVLFSFYTISKLRNIIQNRIQNTYRLFCFSILETESMALCILDRHSITGLHPQSYEDKQFATGSTANQRTERAMNFNCLTNLNSSFYWDIVLHNHKQVAAGLRQMVSMSRHQLGFNKVHCLAGFSSGQFFI